MAATAQHSAFASAAVFAGGLAVGLGGAYALSRSSFAPATKPTKSTQNKASKTFNLARSADKADTPKVSDAVAAVTDLKGAGPKPEIKEPAVELPPAPTEPLQAPARTAATTMSLSGPTPAIKELAQSEAAVPAWLSGTLESSLKATPLGAVEKLAYKHSTALFVYESETNANFGAWAEAEAKQAASKGFTVGRPKVFSMQTRSGAGTAIAGYIAEKGTTSTASAGSQRKVVTALTNAQGLIAMAPALSALPAQSDSRLIIQVSAASQVLGASEDESLRIANDYAAVLTAAGVLSSGTADFSVVLSSGRQEIVDVAAAAYAAGAQGHVVHVFDGAYAGRELAPLKESAVAAGPNVSVALAAQRIASFDYAGPLDAKNVVVLPNGPHFLAARALLTASGAASVGVVGARVVRPWSDAELLKVLPKTATRVHVAEEVRGGSGLLFEDVQAAVLGDNVVRAVLPVSLAPGQALTASQYVALLRAAAAKTSINLATVLSAAEAPIAGVVADQRIATFLDTDASATAQTAPLLARTLRERSKVTAARLLSRYDNFEAGGLVRSDLLIGPASQADDALPVQLAAQAAGTQTLVVSDAVAVLKASDAFAGLAKGATVIINAAGWSSEDLESKLRAQDKRRLAAVGARVYLVDTQAAAESLAGGPKSSAVARETAAAVLLAVFLRAHLGSTPDSISALLQRSLGVAPLGETGLTGLIEAAQRNTQLIAFKTAEWAAAEATTEAEKALADRPLSGKFNSFVPNPDAAVIEAQEANKSALRTTWALPAWQLLFSEAYGLETQSLRPDLHEQTWKVKVTENRRLTPTDYDRNVFHMEFSSAGTGLKYEVGEALGVHGWNDADEVKEFLAWTGFDGDEVVSVPSQADPTRYESRTVFQVLQQRLDIFGKPPKRFYEELSKIAADKDEARWLRFIASAEGSATFKKLAEVETVTYADVLRMFPSARLPLDRLMTEVSPIEPRHYSIASAQAAVGDSIHLLVVTVDWKTPSGSPRYGQCTRYLANLPVGAEVTVSLKPSIMKLPPLTTQPIIMAGLGTGAAPFRAYIQARAVQKAQGLPIGPLIYCFGSRYEASEFLYGEELKAYERDGLITLLTAFSRDQKEKIYIQDRIRQNSATITKYLTAKDEKDKGYFALCGPTWPVPDVTQALLDGFVDQGIAAEIAPETLEALKEEERYILEVY